jgi:hypothetical protein
MEAVTIMPKDLITLELKGCIEDWRFANDGSVHVLLANPVRANCCGRRHAWFINRDGETRCFSCDDKYRAELAGRRFAIHAEASA